MLGYSVRVLCVPARRRQKMTRKSRLCPWLGLVLVSGTWLIQAQQKQNPNFQGIVITVTENSQANIAHYRFEPGSRTKWHIHEKGQIILVEEGVGRTQVKGGPVIELHAGDTIYCPPGVAHWHGAAPNQG